METLLGLALKSLLIAGSTLALLHLTRARSSAERSWIAHLGLFALVALPLASLALPALHVDALAMMTPAPEPALSTPVVATVSDGASTVVANAPPAAPIVAEATSIDWTPYAYAVPAIALLLITMLALLRLFALRSRAEVLVDPVWLSALAHAQRRMGFKNGTALLTSNELTSPISWGLMRPVILLNDEALEATGEAEAIIAHELAHVARLDWAKLMLARIATAIFWFNPLAWVLAREAHQLREEAADDAVLAANIADTDYAQLLVGIARHECKGLLLGAHGVAPGKDSLRRRVSRVLDGSLARGPAARSWVAGFAGGMLVMAAPLAALTFAPKEKLPPDTLIGTKFAETGARHTGVNGTHAIAPTVAQAVTTVVATAVAAATGSHPEDWTEAQDEARNAAIDAEEARMDAIEARREAKLHKKDAIDAAIEMKLLGVTPEYVAAIHAAAPHLRNLDTDDLVEFRAKGVTPQFIRALTDAGYRNASAEDIGDAYVLGVTPNYIREISAAGYRPSLEDVAELHTMGVTGDYIGRFRRAGHTRLSVKQLIKLHTLGVQPEDLKSERNSDP